MRKFNAGLVVLAALFGAGANAAPVPFELTGDGIVWSWTSSNVGASTGMILLSADVSGSTLGAGDIRLHAVELKANNNFVIGQAPTASGGTGTWSWVDNANLNASGCSGVGADTNQFCFTANDIATSASDDANFDLSVFFDFSQGALPDMLHLKVEWEKYNPEGNWSFEDQLDGYKTQVTWQDVPRTETRTVTSTVDCVKNRTDCKSGKKRIETTEEVTVTDKEKVETQVPVYKKVKVYAPTWDHVGGLISQDFAHTEVPVPGTLGLLGCGLIALGMVRRRAA